MFSFLTDLFTHFCFVSYTYKYIVKTIVNKQKTQYRTWNQLEFKQNAAGVKRGKTAQARLV